VNIFFPFKGNIPYRPRTAILLKMDNHTTTATAITANNSANFSSSSSTITDTAVTAAVDATHHHLPDPSLNHQNGTTTTATRRRSLRQDLQSLLVTREVTNNNSASSNTSSSPLHAKKPSREQLQEAAMLFQDKSLLPPLNLPGEGFFGSPPMTTILVIVFMLVVFIHQYKTRQSKHHVLASYRLLVEKRAIHTAFVAVLSHPPRTIRRPRQRRSQRRRRRRHARSHSSFHQQQQQQQPQPNVHGNNDNHHVWRRTRRSLLQWQLFLYEARHCCLDCWRQTWKSITRGHVSGLPLLLYNVHILWSCRDLERATVSSSQYQPHYPYSSIIDTHDDKDDILDNVLFNNSNNNQHRLQYLRLLVALAFLTFGLELVTTHFLLQTPLLAVAETNPSSPSSTTTSSSTENASSTLSITATDLIVVNHPVNSSTNAGDDVSLSSYLHVGIPGPPLSGGQRAEYQTRQQRESAQERKTFWRQSLLYKRMGTMTAITTALLWIHRAHFHGVHMAHAQYEVQLEYYLTQQEQVLQHQQQHADEDESYDKSSDPPVLPIVNGDNLYPSFNVLPFLGNPSFLNAPTSATISLISYSMAILLLLVLSRFSHPGWAVLCGSIVGLLWGGMFPTSSHHVPVAMDGNNNIQNPMLGDDSVDGGFLHFLAQPYYGGWLIFLLILFSLLSLKRTRKWSGWLPFIDFVAWGSSTSGTSSSNCSSTAANAVTANSNSGTCQQDQQQRQANLLRRGTRFMIARNNEQEVFGFMDDDDHSHHGNDTDEDTESEASSQNENDDYDDIFLVDNDTMERQHHQSFAPSLEVDNSDGGGEIYGRLPSLGDFLDEEDEGDGDLELALHVRMSLQQPQYNNARPP
jgi:hypothetical protein